LHHPLTWEHQVTRTVNEKEGRRKGGVRRELEHLESAKE